MDCVTRPVGRLGLAAAWLSAITALVAGGCSRTHYRLDANRDAYQMIEQKSVDPRWGLPHFSIDQDPRARYFDPTDPDNPPMPLDDPFSHKYMQVVDGKRGYKHWLENGVYYKLENPKWLELLSQYAQITPEGALRLTLEDAVQVAQIHSPQYRQQIETIYLSALDVTTERFRFDSQFFGTNNTFFTALGRLRPGGDQTTLNTDTTFQMRRRFATGADLLVQFANSFVWTFTGQDTNFASSLISFNLIQPLLRAGGRAVVLEQLTIVERGLLANLRTFERYRHGFFTNVAVGNFGVGQVQRRGGFFGGTGLTGFTGQGSGGFGGIGDITGFGRGGFGGGGGLDGGGGGQGFAGGGAGNVGGFVGIQQLLQQIRNRQTNLDLQLRTLALLEANFEAGLIDLIQVDQFRQSIETERALLLQSQNQLQTLLDAYKTQTLGLPPDLPIEVDDSLIRQFQLIDPRLTVVQSQIADFVEDFGATIEVPSPEAIERAVQGLVELREDVVPIFELVEQDLERLLERAEIRMRGMTEAERRLFELDIARLRETYADLQLRFEQVSEQLAALRAALPVPDAALAADSVVAVATALGGLLQELSLVEARARLESVYVERIELTPEQALQIARLNRLDWMNNRAALVDTWRLITFNANALQSGLDLTFSGDIGTVGDNALRFQAEDASLRMGVRFDAPFTRLLERNNFRQILIDYQQDRRQLIQFEDTVHQTLRALLRNLEQLRVNLEIQRRAVVIAVRRVDQTREVLNEPPPPAIPGQAAPQLGPTAALDLLRALQDLRDTQDNFMSVWLNYYAARMALVRDLGVMQLDHRGIWIDQPVNPADWLAGGDVCAMPPAVPLEWLNEAGVGPEDLTAPPAEAAAPPLDGPAGGPVIQGGELPPPGVPGAQVAPPPGAIGAPVAAPAMPPAAGPTLFPPQASMSPAAGTPVALPTAGSATDEQRNFIARSWSWLTGKSSASPTPVVR